MKKSDFQKISLENGLRVVLISRSESLGSTVLVLTEAGSEYETEKLNGISHFSEHMMFKGTKNRPHPSIIAKELDSLGTAYNAFTSSEWTGYWAKVQNKKFDKVLEIIFDLYLNPIFDPKEIEKEKGVVIEEINMYRDNPQYDVQEIFNRLLYGDQPAGRSILGTAENIKGFQRENFLSYRKNYYTAPGTVVIVSGNFDNKEVLHKIKETFRHFNRFKGGERAEIKEGQARPAVLVEPKESNQTHLVLGTRAFSIFDKRRFILELLSEILGGGMSSRLFLKIRDELGAAYYIRAGADFGLDYGALRISAGINHEKIEEVLKAAVKEMENLSKKAVSQKELQKAKDSLIGHLILSLETSDGLAEFYGSQEILTKSILSLDETIKNYQKVSPEDIKKTAQFIFKNKNLNLALIGPFKNDSRFQKFLNFNA